MRLPRGSKEQMHGFETGKLELWKKQDLQEQVLKTRKLLPLEEVDLRVEERRSYQKYSRWNSWPSRRNKMLLECIMNTLGIYLEQLCYRVYTHFDDMQPPQHQTNHAS